MSIGSLFWLRRQKLGAEADRSKCGQQYLSRSYKGSVRVCSVSGSVRVVSRSCGLSVSM